MTDIKYIEYIDIEYLREPEFQVNLITDLVLEDEAKATAMVQALSHRYTVEKSTEDVWSAGFAANKGEGQIFFLHGKPGVGQTTTAGLLEFEL
jgi:flagellar biosynthesis GTPase FlhF